MADLVVDGIEYAGALGTQHPAQKLALAGLGRVLIVGEEGAGKSTIPEVLTLALFGKGSPRLDGAVLRESAVVNNRTKGGYYAKVDLQANGHAASILQAYKHSQHGSKYQIFVDGALKTPDGKRQQRQLINQLIPISYDEWLGVGYLSQGVIHGLLTSSPASKRSYLSSVFGLDVYEDLIDAAVADAKTLRADSGNAVELTQELADARAVHKRSQRELVDVFNDPLLARCKRHEDLLALAKEAKREHSQLLQAYAKQDSYAKMQKAYAQAKDEHKQALARAEAKGIAAADDVDELEAKLASAQTKLARVAARQQQAEAARGDLTRATAKMKAARAELRAAEAQFSATEIALDKAKAAGWLTTGDGALSALSRAPNDLTLAPLMKAKAAADDLKSLAGKIQSAAVSIDKLRKASAHGASCPMCTQSLDADTVSELLRGLRAERSRASTQLGEALTRTLDGLGVLAVGFVGADVATVTALVKKRVAMATAAVEAHRESRSALDRLTMAYETTVERVASLKAAGNGGADATPDGADVVEAATANVATLRKKLALLNALKLSAKALANAKASVADLPTSTATKDEVKRARKRTDDLTALVARVDVARARGVQTAYAVEKLEAKVAGIGDAVLELKGLDDHLIPYLNTLRSAKVNECLGVLGTVLPVYVDAMFGGRYAGADLKLEASANFKSFDLKLKTAGKRNYVTPLQASGGQRRRFTLAILGALREVTPRRSNIMFLDEPFADLKRDGKDRFVERVLPMMLERCKGLTSVFVIAHDQEILQGAPTSFDHVWTVRLDPKLGSIVSTTPERLNRRDH